MGWLPCLVHPFDRGDHGTHMEKECCDSVSPEQMMLVGFCNFPRNILSTQNFGMSKIIVLDLIK
jgi:hypothetical protein